VLVKLEHMRLAVTIEPTAAGAQGAPVAVSVGNIRVLLAPVFFANVPSIRALNHVEECLADCSAGRFSN